MFDKYTHIKLEKQGCCFLSSLSYQTLSVVGSFCREDRIFPPLQPVTAAGGWWRGEEREVQSAEVHLRSFPRLVRQDNTMFSTIQYSNNNTIHKVNVNVHVIVYSL